MTKRDRCGVSLYYPNNIIGKESVCTNCFRKEKEKMFEDAEQIKETVSKEVKRDLKADLELCDRAIQDAIERALKAEADFKRQEEYSDMLEDERNELYNLAWELVDTLNVAQQSLHENGIGIVDDRDVMNKVREVLGGES